MNMSFSIKTVLGIALLQSAALFTLVWFSLDNLSNLNQDALTKRAESTTRIFTSMAQDSILATDLAKLDSFVSDVLRIPEVEYVKIYDKSTILSEGGNEELLSRKFVEDVRFDLVSDGIFDTANNIKINNEIYGRVEIGLSVEQLENIVSDARNKLLSIALAEILIVVILSLLLAVYLTRMLRKLSDAAIEIMEGGPGVTVEIKGDDEISEVARAFNMMSEQMAVTYKELDDSLQSSHKISNNLIESELRMRAVMNTAVDGFIIINEHGEIVDTNIAAEITFGYTKGELLSKGISTLLADIETDQVIGMGKRSINNQLGSVAGKSREVVARKKDGESFPVELSVSEIKIHNEPHYVGLIRDLTEQKVIQSKSKYNEALKTAITQASLDALITINAEGEILDFNKSAEVMYGYDKNEVLGSEISSIVIPENLRQAHHDGMKKYLETGIGPVIGQRVKVPSIRKNGEEFPAELTVIPIEVENTMLFTSFIRDITDQVKSEEELKTAKEQAEQANEAKTRFLASMSHEIRTPINAVLGTMELMADTEMNIEQEKYISTARKSGRGLLSIVNNILDFSKIESGLMEVYSADVDVDTMINSVIEILNPIARDKDLSLSSFIDLSVPKVIRVDEAKIRQVLINLVNNSIKFTRLGGVGISMLNKQIDGVDGVEIIVEDTGIGLSESEMSHLFKEFSQVENDLSSDYDGSGLGLAISKRLINMMGGDIRAESKLGAGSKFIISLPLREKPKSEVPELKAEFINKSICILMDDGLQKRYIEMQCGNMGLIIENNIMTADILLTDDISNKDSLKARSEANKNSILLTDSRKVSIDFKCTYMYQNPITRCDIKKMIEAKYQETDNSCIKTVKNNTDNMESNSTVKPIILLVDDSEANQMVGSGMLKKAGYQVDIANDGSEALNLHKDNQYDLILMDMRMPVMDGLQATSLIRQMEDPSKSEIPIVAMTANAVKEDLEKCIETGMNDYITKPVSRNDLLKIVDKWINPSVQGDNQMSNMKNQPDLKVDLIDESAFVTLAEDTSEELVPRMIEIFLNESRARMQHIIELDPVDDIVIIGDEAHTLKSTSITFGAKYMHVLSKELEKACKSNDIDAANKIIPELVEVAATTFDWFDRHFNMSDQS